MEEQGNPTAWCCQLDRELHMDNGEQKIGKVQGKIMISDAEKVHEVTGSYVAYTIVFGNQVVKRRYSEFESLRKLLCRIYKTVIVPPMPEKHTLAKYATMQGKTKDDLSTIELRKRMLQSFLNRIAAHELLCAEHVFHRFLEPGAWADVLFSQSIDKKERIGEDNIHTSTSFGTSSIPVPTTTMLGVTRKLKNPDSKFLDCERFIANFDEQIQAIERSSRKISKKTDELAGTYGELGAVFNAFSLHENNSQLLANAIEKVGQAMDSTYLSTNSMVFPIPFHSAESMFMQLRDVGEKYLEPVHEHLQFVDSVKSVLKNRLQKHLLYEDLGDQLESKRFQLNNIDHQPSSGNSASSPSNPLSPAAPTFPEQRSSGIGGGIGKMMGKLGGKIQNMIDNDPEMTRRKQSARLRDTITQIEKTRDDAHSNLLRVSEQTQQDLDRFQLQKEEDWKHLIVEYAKTQVDWCQKNINAWQEATAEIKKIPLV